MSALESRILAIHIAFAVGCAICFWPPLFLLKGGRAHVTIGKLYALLLALMTTTALTITALAFHGALAAASRPETGMLLDPYRKDPFVYRMHLAFLAFIAIGTVQALAFGMSALKARPSAAAAIVHSVLGSVGLVIAGCGVELAFLPMIVVGVVGAAMGFYFARRCRVASASLRIADHLTGLIASGVLSYSAIAIVVANRTIPEFFHGPGGIVIWVMPTLMGLPAIVRLRKLEVGK